MRLRWVALIALLLVLGWAFTAHRLLAANRALRAQLAQPQPTPPTPRVGPTPDSGSPSSTNNGGEEAEWNLPFAQELEPGWIVTRLQAMTQPPYGQMLRQATEDLDGDGTPEQIALTTDPQAESRFTLTVNGASVSGALCDDVEGFYVVDLDRADSYKEVAVHTPGPSDDNEHLLFRYQSGGLRQLGMLTRWPVYPGDGSAIVRDWQGFWPDRRKFVLQADRLVEVTQPYLYVGVQATAREPVVLRKRPDGGPAVERLSSGRGLHLLLAQYHDDQPTAYLAVSDHGLVGWLDADPYGSLDGLHIAD